MTYMYYASAALLVIFSVYRPFITKLDKVKYGALGGASFLAPFVIDYNNRATSTNQQQHQQQLNIKYARLAYIIAKLILRCSGIVYAYCVHCVCLRSVYKMAFSNHFYKAKFKHSGVWLCSSRLVYFDHFDGYH